MLMDMVTGLKILSPGWKFQTMQQKKGIVMTKQECAIVMAYTGTVMLTGDNLDIYYKYLNDIMGRPVYTHELAFKEIQKQIKEKSMDDFLKLCREASDE